MVAAARTNTARHRRALHLSGALTRYHYEMYRPGKNMVSPQKVIRVLKEGKIRFVLMGTHGIGGWRKQPRATQDVDVLVAKKDHKKAVRILHEAFPHLELQDGLVVTRFLDARSKDPVIDIMRPLETVLKLAFKYSIAVGKTHRVPDLEMALVSKFAAMVSPYRSQEKKLIDGGDFINIVKNNIEKINHKKLERLANKVYQDGGREITAMVEDIEAGRKITF